MIPVRITGHIYIRKGPGTQYSSIGDVMPSGRIITMEGIEVGESYKGICDWYYLTNSNGAKQYYWGGGVEKVEPPEPLPGSPTEKIADGK